MLLIFYLVFNSVVFGWPLACSFELSQQDWIFLRVIDALGEVDLRLVKGREVLEGVFSVVLQLTKINLLFVVQGYVDSLI